MNNKLSKNAKLLMISDLIYSITAIFSETFLVAYVLKVTNENIQTISIYYIILYLLLGIGIVLIGIFLKKHVKHSNKILSVGIITRAIFIMFTALLSEKIAQYYVIVAIIFAISEILYWCAHELIYVDVTNNENRKKYMSMKKIFSKMINIMVPIILGTSIEMTSFSKIAIYVLILTIIQVVISILIKPKTFNNKKDFKEKYSMKALINYIKESKDKKIKIYQLSAVAYGIVESSISTLIVIITIMTFKTSLNLGILTTIFALFSVISLTLYNKYYNQKRAHIFLIVLPLLMVTGIIGLLFDISKITLIIYNFVYAISFCIFDVMYNTKKGNLIKECGLSKYKIEFIGQCSIFITIGRIVGYALMLLTSFSTNILFFKILLLVVTAFAPIYCYLMYKLETIK